MTGRGMGSCGRGVRFRAPIAPFRGQLHPEDLREIIREEVDAALKAQKKQ